MGRCNNRRRQEEAQAARNTPARARFSSGPPKTRKPIKKTAVVEKLSQRVKAPTQEAASSRASTKPVAPKLRIDVDKLDVLEFSKEAIDTITKILTDLKVIEDGVQEIEHTNESPATIDSPDTDGSSELGPTSTENGDSTTTDPQELFVDEHDTKRDPFLRHLTQHLSFPIKTAKRALRAVQAWDEDGSKLAHVLDWLCLHLTEAELDNGFHVNQDYAASSSTNMSATAMKRQQQFVAVPHPSISVAPRLTRDAEWRRQARLQERALPYVKLGFLHSEVVAVLEKDGPEQDQVVVEAIQDRETIRYLLERLEQQEGVSKTQTAFLEDAEAELEQESEALSAIYDDQFEVLDDGKYYKITLPDIDTLPNQLSLHVFVRLDGPPLFLLHHSALPWHFLRNIHVELIKLPNEGAAVTFDVVNFLTESLPDLWNDYVNEQEADGRFPTSEGDVNKASDVHDTALGRRQRARLKSAAKAFDSGEHDKRETDRRNKMEHERLERVRAEDKNIRQSMADQAIFQRERERFEEGLRKTSRAAMSIAFNNGSTVEEARAAAEKAEAAYRKEHGFESEEAENSAGAPIMGDTSDDEKEGENSADAGPALNAARATPTTTAFMERLRVMYANAAMGKFELDDAEEDQTAEELPTPIAAPVGEVARIMQDHVIAVQNEQPWLVAPEARVPRVGDHSTALEDLTERQKEISQNLQTELQKSLENPSERVKAIREQTRALPAYQMRNTIVSTVRANQVTLISASTGAGKTTVVPGLLLNHMIEQGLGCHANIWVTQPRRISAIGVAERISSERGEKVGGTCGYSIKLEKRCSKKTRITLCTTGVLLRRLQCDPDLANVSHVIVDEVHERDINSDFALIILRDLLKRRKSLKLILMSATFDKDIFASYFDDCATVDIPGRAFPVQEFRLEDVLQITGYEVQEGSDYAWKESAKSPSRLSKTALKRMYYPKFNSTTIHSLSLIDETVINFELVAELVEHLCIHGKEGAILVFMPGMAEITNTIDEMRRKELFQSDLADIYPLHSMLSTAEQTQVFEIPPKGVRKIVVATNIAETSITVADVVYVVDSGRVKENRRDEVKETPALVECWVSRASAQQRRGRAGRVQPGIAYHLFSSHTFDSELKDYQLPEISRVGIEELVLQVLVLDLGQPSAFLGKALTPPTAAAMKNALKLLEELGAVECDLQAVVEDSKTCASLTDTTTQLTALGFHLATLPVEPRIGKLIIYGALFLCVDPALTIAASMASKSPFLSPFDNREAANESRKAFSIDDSDHLTIVTAFKKWRELRIRKGDGAASRFARENFLSRIALFQIEELRKQFSSLLVEIGFLPAGFRLERAGETSDSNKNAKNISLLKAVLCAGLYPNIILAPRTLLDGTHKQPAGEMAFRSRTKGDVYLHPSTLAYGAKQLKHRYICYREIMLTSKLYVRDATAVSPFALLLFGGALHVYHKEGVITVDEWLKFRVPGKRPAALIKHLRSQMEGMLLRKIVSPEDDVSATVESQALIESINTLFQQEIRQDQGDVGRTDGAEIVRPWHGNESSQQSGRTRGRGGGRGHQQHGGGGRGRGRSNR